MLNEAEIIKKIQIKADKDAANVLITSYYKDIYAFVFKQTGNKDLSMDITQNIFVSMLQSIRLYDKRKSSFRNWLYRIASNKIIDYYRSNAYKFTNFKVDLSECDFQSDFNIETLFENKEISVFISNYIARCDLEAQQILRLKLYSEKTFHEIAIILNLSDNTVKTKYYREKEKLRKVLIEYGY